MVITSQPKILVLLQCRFLRPRANFGAYFMLDAYCFDMLIVHLVEEVMGKLSVSVEIRILKALKFSGESYVLTAQ